MANQRKTKSRSVERLLNIRQEKSIIVFEAPL